MKTFAYCLALTSITNAVSIRGSYIRVAHAHYGKPSSVGKVLKSAENSDNLANSNVYSRKPLQEALSSPSFVPALPRPARFLR